MNSYWENLALMIGAIVGVGKLLWDVFESYAQEYAEMISGGAQTNDEVEEKRIESKEDRMIYKDLRDRVNRQDEKIREIRDELHEWKDQYYELHTSSKEVKWRNRLLERSNRKLQKAIVVLREYLEKVAERLAEYEDIDPPPQISKEALTMGDINDELLSKIGDPDVETPLDEIFNEDDIPSDEEFDYHNPPGPDPDE